MPPTVLAPVQPTRRIRAPWRALTHIGGKSPRRMAVILKIIWRAAPAPCGRRLGVSAKRLMSGHPQNVRLSGGDDAKPDGMIVGREGGPRNTPGSGIAGAPARRGC